MIRLHYSITDVLEECIAQLESGNRLITARKRPSFHPSSVAGAKGSRGRRSDINHFSPVVLRTALRSDNEDLGDESGTSPLDTNPTAGDSSLDDEYSREWIDLNSKKSS